MQDHVVCMICGKKFKQIQYLHLHHKHNITFEQYVAQFPDAPVISDNSSQRRTASLKGHEVSDECKQKISQSNKESWKENPNQGRTGSPLPEESKKKLSEKLKGHEVSEETRNKISEAGIGRKAWNKDLTKKNDERLMTVSKKVSKWRKEYLLKQKESEHNNEVQ